jgi:integrase
MARRRKRGSGTIQKQRDGSFIARTAGRERSGRFPDRPAAEEALERWNVQLGTGVNPNDARQKLRDFARTWLVEVVQPHKRPGTFAFYLRHIGYATAIIGDIPLEGLTVRVIEKCLAQLTRNGLSPRSVEHVRAVLRNALNVAKRWKLITENPAADAPAIAVYERPERALTVVQVAVLLAAVEMDRLCALFHLALTLGLRRGELLGLRWSDIDWAAGTITISQQVSEGEGRPTAIVPYVKSDEGQRVLPLPSDLAARLQARYAADEAEARIAQERARLAAEKAGTPIPLVRWNPHGLVFCSEAGTVMQPSNLNRRIAELVKRVNRATTDPALRLPLDLSPHTLRHTALTDLAAHGEAKAVQNIAGHADIATTMELYAGRRMAAMRATVEAVEEARRKTGT